MGSLFEELAAREAAVGACVEESTARIVELTGRLGAERERLSRLVVTRETLAELAAEGSGLLEVRCPAVVVGVGQVQGAVAVVGWCPVSVVGGR